MHLSGTLKSTIALGSWLLVTVATTDARATPDFPGKVQDYYHISTLPESPMGCGLCHQSDSGGDPTTLVLFGRLLFAQYGVVAYNENSLQAALVALDRDDPVLGADIRNGRDPNGDLGGNGQSGGGASAEGGPVSEIFSDPVPQYGCHVDSAVRGPRRSWSPLALAVAVILAARRRRARHGAGGGAQKRKKPDS